LGSRKTAAKEEKRKALLSLEKPGYHGKRKHSKRTLRARTELGTLKGGKKRGATRLKKGDPLRKDGKGGLAFEGNKKSFLRRSGQE